MPADDDTRLKAERARNATHGLRIVAFWQGGTAAHDLKPGARLVLGRADDCDVRVTDDSVSRHHAAVHGGPPARVEDLGSANGTWVGDQRLEPGVPVPLGGSAVVEMGDALVVLRPAPADALDAVVEPSPALPATKDGPLARVSEMVDLVAATTIPVLLLGETGVGKGLVAETIHRRSPRAGGSFVRLNCAALTETLLETELFGHERGAFTGAQQAKPGLLEAASGGTILLDEAGDMPASTQAKLLHVLEHNEVIRVGAVKPRPIDVRFIAATNRDLTSLVSEGRFRQDLFFRLDGVTIRVPPLRERIAEIPQLARVFAEEASRQMGLPAPEITDEASRLLFAHAWPGNVRELRNVMVRATLFSQGKKIGVELFELARGAHAVAPGREPPPSLRDEVRELEKGRIVEALRRCGNNQVEAAKALGISRGTLRSRMKELGLLPR